MGPRRLPALVLWAGVASLCVALSAQKIRSYDYWWHLATGALIAETGSVPSADPYSYSVPGSPWLDVHWLFQLALYALYALGGHTAVALAQVACMGLIAWLLVAAGRGTRCPVVTAVALALALVVVSDRLMPRPELPTFVLLSLYLWLIERDERTGDAAVWALVPLQVLWSNTHGLHALGPALLGFHWLGGFIDRMRGAPLPAPLQRSRRLGILLVFVCLATLATPHGLELLRYSVLQLTMIGSREQREAIGLRSVEIGSLIFGWRRLPPPVPAAFAGLALLSGAVLAAGWRRVRAADVLIGGSFLVLALAAMRNTALFALVAVPLVTRNWLALRVGATPSCSRRARWGTVAVGVVLLALAAAATRGQVMSRLAFVREPGLGVFEVFHPVAATEWIARHRPPGPIAHHMADGGYLIWRLHPDYRVLSDGRLEVYRDRPEVLWLSSEAAFRALDRTYRFNTALVHITHLNQAPLLGALHRDPLWKLVFADEIAAVFVREPHGAGWEGFDVDAPDAFEPLDDERSLSDLTRRVGRAQLLEALGHRREARRTRAELRRRYQGW